MALMNSFRVTALAAAGMISGLTLASAQCPNTSPSFTPNFSAAGAGSCFQFNSTSTLPSITTSALAPAPMLQLTPSTPSLAVSAWYTNPQPVATGFTTTFSFQLGASNTQTHADGIAFVIQNSPSGTGSGLSALGSGGGGIGYAGIPNSLAIEFDTFPNAGDPNDNDVSIQSCGTAANNSDLTSTCHIANNPLTGTGVTLWDGRVHTATVTYSVPSTCGTSSCSTIDVILDGHDLFAGGISFDITTIGLTNSAAFVGFTAGTGADDEEQDIDSWTFASSQTQSGTVTSTQSTPTTFDFSGGFETNNPNNGYNFSAQQSPQTTSPQTVQMTVTALPMTQAACNAIVQQNVKQFPNANCFVYQNGGGAGQDAAVMFAVTCTQTNGTQGSCGSTQPFYADLGTQFSFSCTENPGLTCPASTSDTSGGSFGLPHLTPMDGTPSIGFLKGDGPDPAHPCTPGGTPLFTSNQIEDFKLGDTSGGAKGGSGGTTSCWVMTYLTQSETPVVNVTQPKNGGTYQQNQSDTTTTASFTCTAQSTGDPTVVAMGPYLTIPAPPSLYAGVCAATNSVGGAVANGAQFDTSTVGPHTFTAQVQDSAMNTNQTVVNYTVVLAPTISGASSALFTVGTPNSVGFSATGYPTPTFTESGSLPNGVTFIDNKNGTATLSGTATVSGIYNITISAQNGVNPAATLAFTLTSTSTVPTAGTKCNGVYNGNFKGNLTVSAGQTCIFIGGSVTGNVAMTGGSLSLSGTAVTGNFQVVGGTFAVGSGSSIKGNFAVLDLGKSSTQNTVCGSAVGGNLQVVASFTPIAIGNGTSCAGNNIGGSLTVTANAAATAIYGNTIGGSLTDSANLMPTQVFSNKIKSSLTCTADVSITGGGNTAAVKTGQCAKF